MILVWIIFYHRVVMVLQPLDQLEFNQCIATARGSKYLVKSTNQIVPVQIYKIIIAASLSCVVK